MNLTWLRIHTEDDFNGVNGASVCAWVHEEVDFTVYLETLSVSHLTTAVKLPIAANRVHEVTVTEATKYH